MLLLCLHPGGDPGGGAGTGVGVGAGAGGAGAVVLSPLEKPQSEGDLGPGGVGQQGGLGERAPAKTDSKTCQTDSKTCKGRDGMVRRR